MQNGHPRVLGPYAGENFLHGRILSFVSALCETNSPGDSVELLPIEVDAYAALAGSESDALRLRMRLIFSVVMLPEDPEACLLWILSSWYPPIQLRLWPCGMLGMLICQ